MGERIWRIRNTRFWSPKRPIQTLRNIVGDYYNPLHWRRIISRPGWFIAFVRYDPRDK